MTLLPNCSAQNPANPVLHTLGTLALGTSCQTKPILLLAYLILEGPTSQRKLTGLFWPEADNAENNLRVARCALKKCGVALDQQGDMWFTEIDCDAVHLLSAWGLDVNSFSGLFLEGVRFQGVSAEFEDWVDTQREKLAAHQQRELLRLAAHQPAQSAQTLAEQA